MQLYNHQQEIIDKNPFYTGLWLGCGSGKTRIALALATGKTLVICLKTQRDDKNWQTELLKMNKTLDLTVISDDDFLRIHKDIGYYDTVIVDEATKCLGVSTNDKFVKKVRTVKSSKRFEYLVALIEKKKPDRVYLVTATVTKTPLCIWASGVILGKWSMDTFWRFRDKFYFELPMQKRVPIYSAKKTPELKEELINLSKSMGYTGRLEDWNDVPKQTYKDEYLELTNEQKALIKDLHLEYPDPATLNLKRNQIENGILKGDKFGYTPTLEVKDKKIPRLLDYAVEFPQMVVFAKFTKQIEKIENALKKEGYEVYLLTGKTKDRGEMLNTIRSKKEYILIVQTGISKGWELKNCPVIIFASRDHKWEDYNQALGRIQRGDNIKKNLYINLMVKYDHIVSGKGGQNIDKGSMDIAIGKSLSEGEDFNDKLYAK